MLRTTTLLIVFGMHPLRGKAFQAVAWRELCELWNGRYGPGEKA